MKSLRRLISRQPPASTMNGTAAATAVTPNEGAALAAAAAVTANETATIAAASKRLKELATMLDSHGIHSAAEVGASLQQLSQKLLRLHPPAQQPSAPAAADVAALERIYAAPPAAGSAEQPAAVVQPRTKKQRREAARAASGRGGPRTFEFSRFATRSVVLQLMYVGWSYHGFARQADSENTIEGILFPALRRVKLIPEDAEVASLDYSRCGRTDKGVSALGQVLCLKLRSAALAGQALPQPEQELDYPALINKALPDTIRVLGWTDVPGPDFSARFSCGSRQYKYFIVQDGSLDVAAMQQAAQALLGEHDFRNFCKADVLQVQNFKRRVLAVSLEPAGTCCPGMTVLALHITGTAFLWHQVRCIAAVLLMVGRGQERPEIVQQLLDVEQEPCKPQYNMASEEPLLLYSCSFKDLQQPWHCSSTALVRSLTAVGSHLQQHLVGAALTSAIYEQLQQQWRQQWQQQQQQGRGSSAQPPPGGQQQHTQGSSIGSNSSSSSSSCDSRRWVTPMPQQMPLLKREREPTMEERFAKAGISLELLNQPGAARLLQKKAADGV